MKRIKNLSLNTPQRAWSHALATALACSIVAGCGDGSNQPAGTDGGSMDGSRPDVDCLAMLTVVFGTEVSEASTVLNFCQARNITAEFEFDPDAPPEVRNARLRLYAATATDVDCYVDIALPTACGPGFYPLDGTGNTVRIVTLDCPGIPNEYEGEFTANAGYVRVDEFSAGSVGGDFSGMALTTRFVGRVAGLSVISESPLNGVLVIGDFTTREEIIGRDAEGVMCETNSGDADGDGSIWTGFEGEDCDDMNPAVNPSAVEECNGIDDDCDSVIDDNLPIGAVCEAGTGACRRVGRLVGACNLGGGGQMCDAVIGAPSAEVCNGSDDDCDGSTDEQAGCFAVGTPCTNSSDCADRGVCRGDASGGICAARCDASLTPFCADGSACTASSVCDGAGTTPLGSRCETTATGGGDCVANAACVSLGGSFSECVPLCELGTACPNGTACSTFLGREAFLYRGLGWCEQSCVGRVCGNDNWGGSCGTCGSGTTCNDAGLCVASCTPSCTGRTCGSDGCGGTCGTCGGGTACNASGSCVAVGSGCTTNAECGVGRVCIPDSEGWPGGYCTLDCRLARCPTGSTCVTDSTVAICLANCPPACRSGYTCTAAGSANVCF